MRFNQIREMDISNGPGVRVSLFTQGCPFHCKGCFNEITWDYNGGNPFTEDVINTIIDLCKVSYIKGLSILGGEPLSKVNLEELNNLLCRFRNTFGNDKTIWLWTGYKYENLDLSNPDLLAVLSKVDVLVDGQFIEQLKDPNLPYCGSSNQRVIDVQKSFFNKEVILYE